MLNSNTTPYFQGQPLNYECRPGRFFNPNRRIILLAISGEQDNVKNNVYDYIQNLVYFLYIRKGFDFLPTTTPNTIEVETRFHFRDRTELFELLPFLSPCFTKTKINRWTTVHYSKALYHRDIILRTGAIIRPEGNRSFLGWKGPDTGSFANIREECDEEITAGIIASRILTSLGGVPSANSPEAVVSDLIRLGHSPFMKFAGENQFGFYESLNLQLKIMSCPMLPWPLMLETEKTARTPAEALELEQDLLTFTGQYGLTDRVVRDEPPTLLYRVCFPD
jgi:hypothetical protein